MIKAQMGILILIGTLLIGCTPIYWIQYPDSGYYLGTATNMLDSFRYWFNGQPNLQYYPGTSLVLLLPLAFFGENFTILQGFFALISLLGILAIARYFKYHEYGLVGLFTPFLVLTSSLFIIHFYALISDTLFLAVTVFALLCWRKFENSDSIKYLIICCILVAFSSLVRLQGLFFCGALGLALLIHAYQSNQENRFSSILKMMILGGIVCLPFVLWTARNYFEHTPDTFNMANGYFFGLKGLSIYAKGLPGNASAEHIQAAWQFPLERVSLFFGGLFESWYGGLSRMNRYIISAVMITLLLVGVRPWAKRATKLEWLYVGFSMAFILKDVLLTRNLHIVYRYWLPMLPFVIVMMGFGLQTLASLSLWGKVKKPFQFGAVAAAVLLLILSAPNLLKMHQKQSQFEQEHLALAQLKAFADDNIPQESVIATVDWGVLPHTLQRRSIPLLNDPDNKQSIARMQQYQTQYLVTYSKFGRMSEPAENMVVKNPKAFDKIFESNTGSTKTTLKVYRVNLSKLEEN